MEISGQHTMASSLLAMEEQSIPYMSLLPVLHAPPYTNITTGYDFESPASLWDFGKYRSSFLPFRPYILSCKSSDKCHRLYNTDNTCNSADWKH